MLDLRGSSVIVLPQQRESVAWRSGLIGDSFSIDALASNPLKTTNKDIWKRPAAPWRRQNYARGSVAIVIDGPSSSADY